MTEQIPIPAGRRDVRPRQPRPRHWGAGFKPIVSAARQSAPALLVLWSVLSVGLTVWVSETNHLRRAASQETLQGLARTGEWQLSTTLGELDANSEVVLNLPALQEVLRQPVPGVRGEARLGGIFSTQIRAYQRYQAIGVFLPDGAVVALRQAWPALLRPEALKPLIRQGATLAPGQAWISPVAPADLGQPSEQRLLHLVRPIFRADGQRAGVLLFSLRLDQLMRQVDGVINSNPENHRGFVVDAEGRILNPFTGPGDSLSSQLRELMDGGLPRAFPLEWQQLRSRGGAVFTAKNGLFFAAPVRSIRSQSLPAAPATSAPVGAAIDRWQVVLWSPPAALGQGFVLHDHLFQAFVVLLYGLTTAAAIAVVTTLEDRQSTTGKLRLTLDSLLDPHVLLQPVMNAEGRVVDLLVSDGNQAAIRITRQGLPWWRGTPFAIKAEQLSLANPATCI